MSRSSSASSKYMTSFSPWQNAVRVHLRVMGLNEVAMLSTSRRQTMLAPNARSSGNRERPLLPIGQSVQVEASITTRAAMISARVATPQQASQGASRHLAKPARAIATKRQQ